MNNNPQSKALRALLFRLIAAGFVLYLLGDTILAYVRGGENAPSTALLGTSCVILGGGALVILVIALKIWRLDKARAAEEADTEPDDDSPAGE